MIFLEYSQIGDFWHDFRTLDYITFFYKINGLHGKIEELISLRSRYLNGAKMQKEERLQAFKMLNEEQIQFTKDRQKVNAINNSKYLLNSLVKKEVGNGNRTRNL